MILVLLFIYLLICRLAEMEQGVGVTTPHVAQTRVQPTEVVRPYIYKPTPTHTLSQREGGDTTNSVKARNSPVRDLRKEYREWVENARAYDALRATL